MENFFSWYLSPWQKMHRAPFGFWSTFASVPGLLLSLCGFVSGAGGFLGPLGDLFGAGNKAASAAAPTGAGGVADAMRASAGESMDPAALTHALTGHVPTAGSLGAGMGQALGTAQHGFDWGTLLDTTCMVLIVPLVLMRLRDMGQKPPMLYVWLALTYAGTACDALGLFGLDAGIVGTVSGSLTMFMWIWLCMAGTAKPVTDEDGVLARTAREYNQGQGGTPAPAPRTPPPPDPAAAYAPDPGAKV